MLLKCDCCSALTEVCGRDLKYAPASLDFFCSVGCIKQGIQEQKIQESEEAIGQWIGQYRCIRYDKSDHAGFGDGYYSQLLDRWFASRPEAAVAEVLIAWGEDVWYEPFAIKLISGQFLIPDFVLPKRRLFIEVKGQWSMSQITKVKNFLREYPGTNYMLISKLVYAGFLKIQKEGDGNGRRTVRRRRIK